MIFKYLIFISILLSCGKKDADNDLPSNSNTETSTESATESTTSELTDTSIEGIKTFLQSGGYKNWKAESAVHDSIGPHGKVKSYFNSVLVDSLKAKASTHPLKSVAVKELYSSDGITLKGYALEAKLEAGQAGNGWLWFEGTLPNLNEYYGKGLSACTNCHSSGSDFVTSGPP